MQVQVVAALVMINTAAIVTCRGPQGAVVMVVALKIVLRMAAVAVWKVVLEVAIRKLMRAVGVPWEYSRCQFVVASVMVVVGVIVRSQAALVKSSTLSPRLSR